MYTLRFPFRLPPGQEIAVTEQVVKRNNLIFSLKRQDKYYVLLIEGFPSEQVAQQHIKNFWAGLMWVLLHKGLSPDMELEPQKVAYAKDPYEAAENLSKNFHLCRYFENC